MLLSTYVILCPGTTSAIFAHMCVSNSKYKYLLFMCAACYTGTRSTNKHVDCVPAGLAPGPKLD